MYRLDRVEHKKAEFIEKLPVGKHSCKGIGRTMPDPDASLLIEDKLEVPLGKPVPSDINDTTLLYNEYPFYAFILILQNFCFAIIGKQVCEKISFLSIFLCIIL